MKKAEYRKAAKEFKRYFDLKINDFLDPLLTSYDAITSAGCAAVLGFADQRDGLGNTTPHIVYEFE